jgi:hypothetical protein
MKHVAVLVAMFALGSICLAIHLDISDQSERESATIRHDAEVKDLTLSAFRICATFNVRKEQWIAQGSPGGYSATRLVMKTDDFCDNFIQASPDAG